MAITDNTFTGTELEAAIKATPSLIDIIKGAAKNNKLTIRSEQEETDFVKNVEEQIVSKKTKEHADAIEKDVKELTGIDKKDANEKYYDYLKRALAEKLSAIKPLEDKLKELQEKGGGTDADKARIKQLEQAIVDKKKEYDQKTADLTKHIHELKVASSIDSSLASIRSKYKKDIPESIIKVVEAQVRQELINASKIQDDGTITFLDDKKEVIVNPTDYKPKTAEAILGDRLKDLIDTGKQQEGSGSNEGSQGAGGQQQQQQTGSLKRITVVPGTVKNKQQLTEHLMQNGYTADSKEFSEDFDKFGKGLPLR